MSDITQIGGEMNELLSTKMCSPLMIYLAVIVTTSLSIYLTRSSLMRHNTTKMDNLYNMYSMNELKFLIVFGIILYGLCQYNKTTLAWVFLIFPVIYILIQNLIIFIHVSSGINSAPKQVDLSQLYSQQQVGMGGAKIVPEDTQQTKKEVMVPPVNQSTQISESLTGSNIGSNSMGTYSYI